MTVPQQPGFTGQPGYYYATPPPPPPSRANPLAIVAGFVGILLLVAIVVGVVVLATQPPPPVAPCQREDCAPPPSLRPVSGASQPPGTPGPLTTPRPISTTGPGATPFVPPISPTSDSPPAVTGEVWDSDALDFSFEYRASEWTLGPNSTEELVVLNGVFFDAQIVVEAVPATTSVGELLQKELGRTDRFVIGRAPDTDEYDALLGPSIGYVRGEGSVYSGTLVGQDGTPTAPAGLTVLASSDGRITVAMLIIVGTPDRDFSGDTHQHLVRSSADLILKSFDWNTST